MFNNKLNIKRATKAYNKAVAQKLDAQTIADLKSKLDAATQDFSQYNKSNSSSEDDYQDEDDYEDEENEDDYDYDYSSENDYNYEDGQYSY